LIGRQRGREGGREGGRAYLLQRILEVLELGVLQAGVDDDEEDRRAY